MLRICAPFSAINSFGQAMRRITEWIALKTHSRICSKRFQEGVTKYIHGTETRTETRADEEDDEVWRVRHYSIDIVAIMSGGVIKSAR